MVVLLLVVVWLLLLVVLLLVVLLLEEEDNRKSSLLFSFWNTLIRVAHIVLIGLSHSFVTCMCITYLVLTNRIFEGPI